MAVSRRADVWTTIATCSPDDAQHVSDARLIQGPSSEAEAWIPNLRRSVPRRIAFGTPWPRPRPNISR